MTVQELKDSGWIIYECLSGSHAYGTNIPESDKDFRGVYIQPPNQVLGITSYIPQIHSSKSDSIYYEIKEFITLLAKGNPNMLELLNTPQDCIIHKDPIWDLYFHDGFKKIFITKKLKYTFTGYAIDQIKKASKLDKMMNWEKTRVERKDVLDFCYVLLRNEEAMSFKAWENESHKLYTGEYGPKQVKPGVWKPGFEEVYEILDRTNIGLASVNNFPDVYAGYYLKSGGGIISENSNDVQLRSIPKHAPFLFHMRFDKNAYSQHCKDYKSYQNWLENRNVQRYVDVENHGQQIDGKNLLHCVRLLNMSKDIAEGKGIIVRRPEAPYLIEIRKGLHDLQGIIDTGNNLVKEIETLFDNSSLPDEIDMNYLNKFLVEIRFHENSF